MYRLLSLREHANSASWAVFAEHENREMIFDEFKSPSVEIEERSLVKIVDIKKSGIKKCIAFGAIIEGEVQQTKKINHYIPQNSIFQRQLSGFHWNILYDDLLIRQPQVIISVGSVASLRYPTSNRFNLRCANLARECASLRLDQLGLTRERARKILNGHYDGDWLIDDGIFDRLNEINGSVVSGDRLFVIPDIATEIVRNAIEFSSVGKNNSTNAYITREYASVVRKWISCTDMVEHFLAPIQ